MSDEPDVPVPMPTKFGAPFCPSCDYKCGCCCNCDCQTPCPAPDDDGDCCCTERCHGGHEPWDCWDWNTRYRWALAKIRSEPVVICGISHPHIVSPSTAPGSWTLCANCFQAVHLPLIARAALDGEA